MQDQSLLGSCSFLPRPLVLPGGGSSVAHPSAMPLHTAVPASLQSDCRARGPQPGVIKKGPFVTWGCPLCNHSRRHHQSPCPPCQLVTTLPPAVGLLGPLSPSQDRTPHRPRWCECCSRSVQRSLPTWVSLGLHSGLTQALPDLQSSGGPCHPSPPHFSKARPLCLLQLNQASRLLPRPPCQVPKPRSGLSKAVQGLARVPHKEPFTCRAG